MKRTLWILAVMWFVPSLAWAEPCESDEDCAEDELCLFSPCADCPPGEDCEPCSEEGECEPWEDDHHDHGFTSGLECESTDDCPIQFECEEIEIWCSETPESPESCVCDPCEEGADECPPCDCDEEGEGEDEVEEEPCEVEIAFVCVWNPSNCETDADCDDHFECIAGMEICEGHSGSSGGGVACDCPPCEEGADECPPCDCDEEGGENTTDPDEGEGEDEWEENCEVTEWVCAPVEMECSTDEECPEGWECAEAFGPDEPEVACVCPACECDPDDDECECPECDCGEDEPVDDPDESVGACVPEGWEDAFMSGGGGGGTSSGIDEEGTDDPEDPDPDPEDEGGDTEGGDDPDPERASPAGTGSAVGPEAEGGEDGTRPSIAVSQNSGTGNATADEQTPGAVAFAIGNGGPGTDGSASGSDGGGCAVTDGSGSGHTVAFALLGIALLGLMVRRRRALL